MSFVKNFEHSAALFDAAMAEFISLGYEQASINRILHKAGMSKGQFYYHFQNKEGLYLALIEVMIARKRAFLRQTMRPEDFQADIFSIFKTQVRYSMAFAAEYPQIDQFAERFLQEKGRPIYEKALAENNFEENQGMNQLIERAYQKGDFRQDLPLPFIKKTITFLFTNFGNIVKQDEEKWDYEDVEDDLNHLIDFMKSGLAAPQDGPEMASSFAKTADRLPAGQRVSGDWDIWQS